MDVEATLEGLLRHRAASAPDAAVLVQDDRVVTYAELDAQVEAMARGLVGRGVERGDRVAVLLASDLDHVAAVFALWRAGGVWVPLNPQLPDADLAYCVQLTDPRILVTDLAGGTRVAASDQVGLASLASTSIAALAEEDGPEPPGALPGGDAVIAFTSGTTGRPKGATITHRSLRVHSAVAARHYSLGPDDRLLTMLPLYLLSIFLVGPGLAVESGGRCRIVPRYSAEEFIRLAATDRPTVMASVPVFFVDLMELPEEDQQRIDLSSFRIITSGGAPMPAEARAAFETRFDLRFLNVFGGTEAPGLVTTDPLDAPPRPGSVGRALPHIRITAIDEGWNDLPPGEVGDLCTAPVESGELANLYEPMRGYWGDPDQTAEVLSGARLRWGDVGYVDEDGFVFLVDRSKDVIIRGGMNIYPRQLEQIAYQIPGVAEVAVVGAPHARYGEVPVAFVRAQPGTTLDADDLARRVNEQVAGFSRLAAVHLVEDLPRNALGKVLKRELRAQLAGDPGTDPHEETSS